MPSPLRFRSILTSPHLLLLGRRLPIVGALCLLSFGLSNLHSSLSSSAAAAGSLSVLRSRSVQARTKMEAAASSTVPSIVVYVTVPNKEAGKKLAESIVKERLAACVNRVPGILKHLFLTFYYAGVESVYEWKGEIQTDSEELLIIKTRESLLGALTEHVKANHEYELPEVIALPITGGNLQYLEWIKNSTRD
ncbi:CutA 1, chloroplastic-like protein [Drosera capensis]